MRFRLLTKFKVKEERESERGKGGRLREMAIGLRSSAVSLPEMDDEFDDY